MSLIQFLYFLVITDIQATRLDRKGSRTAPIAIISNNNLDTRTPHQPCKEIMLEELVRSTANGSPEETVEKVAEQSLRSSQHSVEVTSKEQVESIGDSQHDLPDEEVEPLDKTCASIEASSEGIGSARSCLKNVDEIEQPSTQTSRQSTDETPDDQVTSEERLKFKSDPPVLSVDDDQMVGTSRDSSQLVSQELEESEPVTDSSKQTTDKMDMMEESSTQTSRDSTKVTSEELIEPESELLEQTVNEMTECSNGISYHVTEATPEELSETESAIDYELEKSAAVIKTELTRIQSFIAESLECVPEMFVQEKVTDEEIVESAIEDIIKNIDEITRSSTNIRESIYKDVYIVPTLSETIESTSPKTVENISKESAEETTKPSSQDHETHEDNVDTTNGTVNGSVCKRHTVHFDTHSGQTNGFSGPKAWRKSMPVTAIVTDYSNGKSSAVIHNKPASSKRTRKTKRYSYQEPRIVRLSSSEKHKSMPPFEGNLVKMASNREELHAKNPVDPPLTENGITSELCKDNEICEDTCEELTAPKIDKPPGRDKSSNRHSSADYTSKTFAQLQLYKQKIGQSYPQGPTASESEKSTYNKLEFNRHSVHGKVLSDKTVQSSYNGQQNHRHSSADYNSNTFVKRQLFEQKIRQFHPQGPAASVTENLKNSVENKRKFNRLSVPVNMSSSYKCVQSPFNGQQNHEQHPANMTETNGVDLPVPGNHKKMLLHRPLKSCKDNMPVSPNNFQPNEDTASNEPTQSSGSKHSMQGYSATETTVEDEPERRMLSNQNGRPSSARVRDLIADFNRAQITSVSQNQECSAPNTVESPDIKTSSSEPTKSSQDNSTEVHSQIMARNWELEKRISGIEGGMDIGIFPNGNLAITDFRASQVKVYNTEGQYQTRLVDIVSSKEAGGKWFPFGIVVGADGAYFLTSKSNFVDVFNAENEHKSQFTSTSPSNYLPTSEKIAFGGIAMDNDGHILVGECRTNHINKHKQDGSHIGSIKINIKPRFLSVCSNGNIAVSAWELNTGVQIIDPKSGQVLHTLSAPTNVPHWCPSGVYYHDNVIFISNCPRTCNSPDGIYCFSLKGEYIGCVTNDVFFPLGLTTDGNRLMVVELKCVKIFQAKLIA